MLAARRALVAADRAADVEVVRSGEVAWRSAADVGNPEVWLIVGPLGLAVGGGNERDPLAVAGQSVGPDASIDIGDAPRLSAAPRHGVEIAVVRIVVGLAPAIRDEVDVVAIG